MGLLPNSVGVKGNPYYKFFFSGGGDGLSRWNFSCQYNNASWVRGICTNFIVIRYPSGPFFFFSFSHLDSFSWTRPVHNIREVMSRFHAEDCFCTVFFLNQATLIFEFFFFFGINVPTLPRAISLSLFLFFSFFFGKKARSNIDIRVGGLSVYSVGLDLHPLWWVVHQPPSPRTPSIIAIEMICFYGMIFIPACMADLIYRAVLRATGLRLVENSYFAPWCSHAQ